MWLLFLQYDYTDATLETGSLIPTGRWNSRIAEAAGLHLVVEGGVGDRDVPVVGVLRVSEPLLGTEGSRCPSQ